MSMTEAGTDTGASEVETIFLSPRVLDEAAFERFGGALRELIDKSRQERSVLEAMVRSAESAGPRMERLAESQRQALRASGDASRRNEEVRTLLSALDARLEEARRADRDLDARGKGVRETVTKAETTLERCERVLERLERVNIPADDLERSAALADQSRQALDDATTRATEVIRLTEEASRDFFRIAQEVAEPMARDRVAAERTSEDMRAAIQQSRLLNKSASESAHALRAALGELESWRGVLIDGESAPMLPPALQSVVDELRAGVMRDIGEMARAMRAVAERTVAVERKPVAVAAQQVVTRPATPAALSGVEYLVSGAD